MLLNRWHSRIANAKFLTGDVIFIIYQRFVFDLARFTDIKVMS